MQIEAIELLRCELMLAIPVATSIGRHDRRPLVIVRVLTSDGVGYGECEALAEPTYTEEYTDGAEAVLRDELIPRLFAGGAEIASPTDGVARLAPVLGHAMAKAGLEMALLDAQLRIEGRSLASMLGATRSFVEAGATIGLGTDEAIEAAVNEAVRLGYRHAKIKIAPRRDVAVVRRVRDLFPNLGLVVDANGSYDFEETEHLSALDELDHLALLSIEQPLAPQDIVGHQALSERLVTPVILDESIANEGMLKLALKLRAMDGVSIKASRLGGILAAHRAVEACRAAGLRLTIGGMFEAGIGRAAQLALAGCAGFDLAGDLGASDRYFVRDLTTPHRIRDGNLAVPDGPGLGVDVDEAFLAEVTARKTVLKAS